MKKFIILFHLFMLVYVTARTQNKIDFNPIDIPFNWEEGISHYMSKLPYSNWSEDEIKKLENSVKGYYLVFLPPKYKTKEKTVKIPILKYYKKRQSLDTLIYVKDIYIEKEGYFRPILNDKNIPIDCIETSIDKSIVLSSDVVKPTMKVFYRKVSLKDYEKGVLGDSIEFTFDYSYIDKPARVLKTTKLTDEIFSEIEYLKVVYLKGFNWSNIIQFNCPTFCPSLNIKVLQLGLRENGYELVITGRLDKATKTALMKFQEENGIRKGSLGFDTFSKLGVPYDFPKRRIVLDSYQYPDSPLMKSVIKKNN